MSYHVSIRPHEFKLMVFNEDDPSQSAEDMTRCEVLMSMTDMAMGDCRLHGAGGQNGKGLTPEINLAIGLELKRLGYEKVYLEVPHGTKATRLGKFVRTDGKLDRYEVDLTKLG